MGHRIFVQRKWAMKEKRLKTTVLELIKKELPPSVYEVIRPTSVKEQECVDYLKPINFKFLNIRAI